MEVAGRDFERHETLLYELELTDNRGNIYPVSLLAIEKIVSDPGDIDVNLAYGTFPHIQTDSSQR